MLYWFQEILLTLLSISTAGVFGSLPRNKWLRRLATAATLFLALVSFYWITVEQMPWIKNLTLPPLSSLPPVSAVLSSPMTILPVIFSGCFLYRLRGQLPFIYGLIEIIVGIGVTSFVITVQNGDASAKAVGIVGGMYILVRGLDNMDKGIPAKMRTHWDRFFPKRRQ